MKIPSSAPGPIAASPAGVRPSNKAMFVVDEVTDEDWRLVGVEKLEVGDKNAGVVLGAEDLV